MLFSSSMSLLLSLEHVHELGSIEQMLFSSSMSLLLSLVDVHELGPGKMLLNSMFSVSEHLESIH